MNTQIISIYNLIFRYFSPDYNMMVYIDGGRGLVQVMLVEKRVEVNDEVMKSYEV